MIIYHSLDKLSKNLFPSATTLEQLAEEVKKKYTFEGHEPKVSIEKDRVAVEIEEAAAISNRDFHKANDLCAEGKFKEAIPTLKEFVKNNPYYSDGFRTLGQAQILAGYYEEGYDNLIEALRLDPSNVWALIMTGNYLSTQKDDTDAAMMYYQIVLEKHPDNFIAINNVGGALLNKKKYEEAEPFFKKAIELNSDYAQSHFGIGCVYKFKGQLLDAFNEMETALKLSPKHEKMLRHQIILGMLEVSKEYCKMYDAFETIIPKLREDLEKKGGIEIKFEQDNKIITDAKMEFAWVHNRPYHLVKYKKSNMDISHIFIHEMVHLVLVLNDKDANANEVFFSNDVTQAAFLKDAVPELRRNLRGIGDEELKKVANDLYGGLALQLNNTAIDMFVEKYIYDNYQELRPVQFNSLMNMLTMNVNSCTDKKIIKVFPQFIVKASRTMNMATALHFQSLFGVNRLDEYNPVNKQEFKNAQQIFESYKFYCEDTRPGEEYDCTREMIDILSCGKYIKWKEVGNGPHIGEGDFSFREDKDLPSPKIPTEKEINVEELGFGKEYDEKTRRANEDFKDNHPDGENPVETMMMSMYMLGAMNYFKNLSDTEIRQIAFEIAWVGTMGINPDKKKGYKIHSVNKDFGGYELLAWYYVSWAWAEPSKLDSLNLPFKNAYSAALQMYNSQNPDNKR